jgi:two-component system phosphate regulon sensor histidine kinase PhoR
MKQLKQHLLKTIGLIVFLALVGSVLVSRALTKPLKELQTAAETMARGDFSTRVKMRTSKELTALGNSFNDMAARINDLFAEVAGRTQEVNAILAAINESLFVVAKDGSLLMANDSFKRLTGKSSIENRYYWELFREPAFEKLIKQAIAGSRHMTGSFDHGGRSYLCGISKLPAREEYVVLLHDVTEEKKLETIKKDFITNVSHELRTPLTAIKGFVETLEDMVSGEGKRYLEIVSRHTDRLINIVADLLLLSEVENPLFKLELHTHDIKTIIDNIVIMFQPRVNQKKLRITVSAPAPQYPVTIDASKFEQVLINLIDNAIKYTDTGEITITLRDEAERTIIDITDTGPGIPAELFGRIFERFFVVDTSRSKKVGGTGLGLSIVKHIVNLHDGTIDVASIPGKGSTFSISLPKLLK